MNNQLRLQYLLTQYAANNCTREELLELFSAIEDADESQELQQSLTHIWQTLSTTDKLPQLDKNKIFNNVVNKKSVRQTHPTRQWLGYAAAAITVFVISFGLYRGLNPTPVITAPPLQAKTISIAPQPNKAILKLANGERIVLNSGKPGIVATQSHIPVRQLSNGAIAYQPDATIKPLGIVFNTLSTPVGGQYAITLIDGTKVWLNAMSSLRYPVTFNGNQRTVELTGEAYFEVAKNKAMPFIVTINHNEVKVYGTHFNIMGYTGEANTNVTLLEGSVKVSSGSDSKMMLPGQQAEIKNDRVALSQADGEQAIAWKNGRFNFSHEHIDVIMRKLSRWFDIDVVYKGKITQEGFVGNLPQSDNLTEVLKTLELTGSVHFKVDGRRVIVMP